MSNLLLRQEVEITITQREDIDSWDAKTGLSETIKAIVAESAGHLNPAKETERTDNLRVFLRLLPTFEIKEGDLLKFRKEEYAIVSVDARGVLPGTHRYRIEAKRT